MRRIADEIEFMAARVREFGIPATMTAKADVMEALRNETSDQWIWTQDRVVTPFGTFKVELKDDAKESIYILPESAT